MSALTKRQITDKNSVATSRWVKPDTSEGNVTRVSGLASSKLSKPVTLAGVVVPEVSFDKLWHVGHMDKSKKKNWSLEGSGMSVSRNPMAWRKIAWLEGDIHEFDVPDNRFLDWHELSAEQKEAIDQWGVEKGYLAPATLYRVSFWDDEADEERFALCETRKETLDFVDKDDQDGVEEIQGYLATDSFPDRAFLGTASSYDQVIAAVWVNEETDFDGVWWADNLDTSRDSAPRGVLAGNKIAEWIDSSRVIEESEVPDLDWEYEDYNYDDDEEIFVFDD